MSAKPRMTERATHDWQELDARHYLHPFTDFRALAAEGSRIITRAEGVYLYDSDGRQILDGMSGLWCVNIGYGREEMAQAIADQCRRLCYYSTFVDTTTPPAAELAWKLAQIAPKGLGHIFYSTGGSEANDQAVRIIHFYFNRLGKPNKKKIISRVDAYHGSTLLTATITGVMFDRIGFDVIDGLVHHISNPNPYRRPDGMSEAQWLEFLVKEFEDKILELGPDNVAMFFAEPIMGAGGVIVPPAGYHKRMKAVCKKYDMFYISDEVVTGFGRLGHMFASEDVFGIVPDIITGAKGVTSGYQPLGITLLSDKIYDVISVPQEEGAMFTTGFTYSGHAVACAAGLKNIEIIEREKICEHVREVGPYFEERLKTLYDLPIVGDVRGKCFMMCVEYVANQNTKETLPHEASIGSRIARLAQKRGALIRPIGHLNVMSPPLVLSKGQVDDLVEILRASAVEAMDELRKEGIWNG